MGIVYLYMELDVCLMFFFMDSLGEVWKFQEDGRSWRTQEEWPWPTALNAQQLQIEVLLAAE